MTIRTVLEQQLKTRQREYLYREQRTVDSYQDGAMTMGEQSTVSFASTDYLGLSQHQRVQESVQDALLRYGNGSVSSPLVVGYTRAHQQLEQELAEFLGFEAVMLFSSGFLANIGVMSALAQREHYFLLDRLCHASLIDGIRLGHSQWRRYPHQNYAALARYCAMHNEQPLFIVSEGVFSTTGSIAELERLNQIAQQHHACLIIDDAHGVGVLGAQGRGALEACQIIAHENLLLTGSFAKAFGGVGGYVAGSAVMIDYLRQFARSYMYTVALSPVQAEINRCCLQLLKQSEPRALMQANVNYFRELASAAGLPISPSSTPIQTLTLNCLKTAINLQQQLITRGYFVGLLRPPSVAKNTACLRLNISALHRQQDLEGIVRALREMI